MTKITSVCNKENMNILKKNKKTKKSSFLDMMKFYTYSTYLPMFLALGIFVFQIMFISLMILNKNLVNFDMIFIMNFLGSLTILYLGLYLLKNKLFYMLRSCITFSLVYFCCYFFFYKCVSNYMFKLYEKDANLIYASLIMNLARIIDVVMITVEDTIILFWIINTFIYIGLKIYHKKKYGPYERDLKKEFKYLYKNSFYKKNKYGLNLLIISDTHNTLKKSEFEKFIRENKFDYCILLGDLTLRDLNIILEFIDKEKIYALLGNHDGDYIKLFGLKNLHNQLYELITKKNKKIKITGIQGSYKYKPGEYPSFTQEECLDLIENMPHADILFTHDGCYNEETNNTSHQGLKGITKYLYKNQCLYHFYGHHHERKEKTLLNKTKSKCIFLYDIIKI